jgi:hypothetical protein
MGISNDSVDIVLSGASGSKQFMNPRFDTNELIICLK